MEKEKFWELADLAKKKDPGFDLYWMAVTLEKATAPNLVSSANINVHLNLFKYSIIFLSKVINFLINNFKF